MTDAAWRVVVIGGASAGAGLLVWGLLKLLADLWRVAMRLQPLSLAARLRALTGEHPGDPTVPLRRPQTLPPISLGMAAYGILGALLARDWILSTYLLGLGLGLAFFLARLATRRTDLSKPVEILIGAFRSQYAIRPTVFAALEGVADLLPKDSPVRQAVETTCAYNRLSRSDALAPLRELGDETLGQFVRALETETTPEAMVRLLKGLEERLKARRRVREAAEGALVLFMGTVYVLAGANLVFGLVVLLVPLMRHYFVAQLGGRLLYMALTLAASGGGVYFLLETRATEEQIL